MCGYPTHKWGQPPLDDMLYQKKILDDIAAKLNISGTGLCKHITVMLLIIVVVRIERMVQREKIHYNAAWWCPHPEAILLLNTKACILLSSFPTWMMKVVLKDVRECVWGIRVGVLATHGQATTTKHHHTTFTQSNPHGTGLHCYPLSFFSSTFFFVDCGNTFKWSIN